MNLLSVLDEIRKQINQLEDEKDKEMDRIEESYNKKISDLKVAFEVNQNLNTTCWKCRGSGKETIYHSTMEDDHGELVNCTMCKGTGEYKMEF